MRYLRNRLTIPIKGYNRSIIYDLNRRDYFFIPNELFEVIKSDLSFEIIDDEYRSFLLENEIVFDINENEVELFPPFSLTFEDPYDFTNIIIDSNIRVQLIEQFDEALIFNLSILVKDSSAAITDNDELMNFINYLEPESIDLHFINGDSKSIDLNLEFIRRSNEIFRVYTYNSVIISPEIRNIFKIYHIQLMEISGAFEDFSKNVFPSKFSVNNELFIESNNHNTYLNKKIYIDLDGNISNSLYTKSLLNISSIDSYHDLMSNLELTKYWDLTKDKIVVCKDCEFRHMCVSSLEIFKQNDVFSTKTECNYNPYISKWKFEKDYMDLKLIGVHFNSKGKFEINYAKIDEINNRLWNDK